MISVVLCDDHMIVRAGLKQIIHQSSDINVIWEFESGEDLLAKSKEIIADVILLDISLPGINGLDVLKKLQEDGIKIPVIMLSMFPEEQYAIRMMKLGASGYLHKDSPPEMLLGAIRTVYKGKSYYSPAVTRKLLEQKEKNQGKLPHERLSSRENEVLEMIGKGISPTEIAKALNLSIKTVSTYRTRILDKMEMNSNAEIIKYMIENNLLLV